MDRHIFKNQNLGNKLSYGPFLRNVQCCEQLWKCFSFDNPACKSMAESLQWSLKVDVRSLKMWCQNPMLPKSAILKKKQKQTPNSIPTWFPSTLVLTDCSGLSFVTVSGSYATGTKKRVKIVGLWQNLKLTTLPPLKVWYCEILSLLDSWTKVGSTPPTPTPREMCDFEILSVSDSGTNVGTTPPPPPRPHVKLGNFEILSVLDSGTKVGSTSSPPPPPHLTENMTLVSFGPGSGTKVGSTTPLTLYSHPHPLKIWDFKILSQLRPAPQENMGLWDFCQFWTREQKLLLQPPPPPPTPPKIWDFVILSVLDSCAREPSWTQFGGASLILQKKSSV